MPTPEDHMAISKRCASLAQVLQATSNIIDSSKSGYGNVSDAKEVQTEALKELKKIFQVDGF